MSANSESRKRREQALFAEPRWAPSDRDRLKGRVLAALRRVYPTSEPIDGDALVDALEDEGLL